MEEALDLSYDRLLNEWNVLIHEEFIARSDAHLPASEVKRRTEGCI